MTCFIKKIAGQGADKEYQSSSGRKEKGIPTLAFHPKAQLKNHEGRSSGLFLCTFPGPSGPSGFIAKELADLRINGLTDSSSRIIRQFANSSIRQSRNIQLRG
jgi:hypothetical protein